MFHPIVSRLLWSPNTIIHLAATAPNLDAGEVTVLQVVNHCAKSPTQYETHYSDQNTLGYPTH